MMAPAGTTAWVERATAAGRLLAAHQVARAVFISLAYTVLARLFCGVYYPLDSTKLGGPGDFEPYAALDWLVVKTLVQYREIPLWNPYVNSGLPLVGDPYIGFFNPVMFL